MVFHHNTRENAALLEPCFKTGRAGQFPQHPHGVGANTCAEPLLRVGPVRQAQQVNNSPHKCCSPRRSIVVLFVLDLTPSIVPEVYNSPMRKHRTYLPSGGSTGCQKPMLSETQDQVHLAITYCLTWTSANKGVCTKPRPVTAWLIDQRSYLPCSFPRN